MADNSNFKWRDVMKIRTGLVVLALSALGACATPEGSMSPHLTLAPDQTFKPEAGKALVIFMRPAVLGFAVQSPVFDGDNYVATVSAKTRVPYQAAPGKHLFMVIGESADFMQAELAAGKTYYALVTPRMGAWKARFSLRPVNSDTPPAEFNEWMAATRPAVANAEGPKWAKENAPSVQEKKNEYLPKWQAKPDAEKPTLNIGSGR
jgi:hypothetical protein